MRKLLALSLISACLTQCDSGLENPNYPIEPSIRFSKISFIETPFVADLDTLKLTISYRDGDSDLGFRSSLDTNEDLEYPYHPYYCFLEDGTGDTTQVPVGIINHGSGAYITIRPQLPISGKLVTDKTRLKTNYEFLPEFDLNKCNFYRSERIIISEDYIDDSYNTIETFEDEFGNKYHIVDEALLYAENENHNNILVEYYVKEGENFVEFDWLEAFCIDYNGRFPFLEKQRGTIEAGPFTIKAKTPWEGEITYAMVSTGFLPIFSTKEMKLRITIKDRALHTSNVLETPAFTLDGIKQD